MPCSPAPQFKYSLSWAATVVDELVAKYTRATDVICRVYDISRYDLVKYLAKPDPLWPYLRERIKYLAICEQRTGKPMDYLTVVEWCKGLHGMKHAHGQGLRLDKRLESIRIRELGNREGGAKAYSAGARPSSFDSPRPTPDSPHQLLLFEEA